MNDAKIYSDGYDAYMTGWSLSDNPHNEFSPEWYKWIEGFKDSEFLT